MDRPPRIQFEQVPNALLIVIGGLLLALGPSASGQKIPDQSTLPPYIEDNSVIGAAAGFKVSFPEPPAAYSDESPTAERAMYALKISDYGDWNGIVLVQRFPVHFANINPQKRVLLKSATRGLQGYGIESFNHTWQLSEHAVTIRAYVKHPDTGQHHAMQVTLAPYRMVVQNVIHQGTTVNHIQTLGFFDSLELTAAKPQWVGPLQTTMNGAYTVDLLGLEFMEMNKPGSSKSFLRGLEHDITEGRADRYEGDYLHPPLNEFQRTRVAALNLTLSEFYPGNERDYAHDLRIQPSSIDHRIAVWEHFAQAYEALLPQIDREDVMQRAALYTLIAVASENPPTHREAFYEQIPLTPEKRDALFSAYDQHFAESRPIEIQAERRPDL
ncbi:MAG: hypothetical protein AAGJ38_09595 [Planctomycetota bacterium]